MSVDFQAPFHGAVALTPGAASVVNGGSALGVNCTVAGAFTALFRDGSSIALQAIVGFQVFPFKAVGIAASPGATATYYALKQDLAP